MAYLLNTFVLQPSNLNQCDGKLLNIIFHEIGNLMKLVGLCPLPSKTASKTAVVPNVESSYNYLKDARNALISVVRNILNIFPALISEHLMKSYATSIVIDCLFSSTCVHPYSACSSVLKVLKLIRDPKDQARIMDYLELIYCHFYNKHINVIKRKWQNVPHETKCPDSDSAFYASDSSLLIDHAQDVNDSGKISITQHSLDHWIAYVRCILSEPHFKHNLFKHLDNMIMKLNLQGRLDIFVGVILPLLETER